jgi:DNA polymerase-3 subunit delta'
MDALSAGSVNRLLAFGGQLSKNKDILQDSLEVMKSWLRDLVVGQLNPERVINQDLAQKIQQASPKMSIAALLDKIDSCRHKFETGPGGHGVKTGQSLAAYDLFLCIL